MSKKIETVGKVYQTTDYERGLYVTWEGDK